MHAAAILAVTRPTGALRLALALLAGLGACASVPQIAPTAIPAPGTVKPEIISRRGPLTPAQSKAVLQKLATEPGDAGLLQRHLATEEEVAGGPLIAGNRTRLLRDGPETFRAMFGAVNLEYYIIEDVAYDGMHLGDLLIAKRQAGIAINVIYDSYGSGSTPDAFFDRLKGAGIKLVSFNPVNPLESKVAYAPNERDHRKILVVDGQVAIVGGVNLSTAYQSNPLGKSSGPPGTTQDQWRDTDLQIEGPAVAEMQKLFLEHWTAQKGEALDTSAMFPANGPNGPAVVRVLGSSPGEAMPDYYAALLTAIRTAEKSIWLTTAYFAPTPDQLGDLKDAARRGVDVRLLLPGRSDSPLSLAVAHSHYTGLLETGVKIFETFDIILHAKTVVVDGVWSSIGSSNFDHRSVIANDEVDVVVLGSQAAQELEDLFGADQAGAKPLTLQSWRDRPLWGRIKERFALLWEKML